MVLNILQYPDQAPTMKAYLSPNISAEIEKLMPHELFLA